MCSLTSGEHSAICSSISRFFFLLCFPIIPVSKAIIEYLRAASDVHAVRYHNNNLIFPQRTLRENF